MVFISEDNFNKNVSRSLPSIFTSRFRRASFPKKHVDDPDGLEELEAFEESLNIPLDERLFEEHTSTSYQKKPRGGYSLNLYFGIPGAGKSTMAAYLAKKDMKKGVRVYSNTAITGTYDVCRADLGTVLIYGGRLLWDEAGLDFDNRKMKMTDDEIYFFKYHRHYEMNVDFFSQGLDVDIKIRKLARHIYLVKPSLIPFFITRREIGRRVGIDQTTHQIIDEYFWKPFGKKRIFAPSVWNMFNTYSRKDLPKKDFAKF